MKQTPVIAQWRTGLLRTLLLLGFSVSAWARGINILDTVIVPPNPTYQKIFVALYGFRSGYYQVLEDPQVFVSESEKIISVDLAIDPVPTGMDCLDASLPWESIVPVGTLSPGNYEVTVNVREGNSPPSEDSRSAFTVYQVGTSGIGGLTTGMTPKRVICRNLSRHQKKVIRDGAGSWDCKAQGLIINPGEKIKQTVIGVAQ
jgi:hypothetical protein